MQGKLNKNVGFTLIFFAFFFLFEPSYALIDPLPDLIGHTILCIALINLADINDKISIAFKAFRMGIALSILRFISILLLDNVFSDGEATTGQLLFVFVLAIFELVIMIPGYKALFEGLLSLGIFVGGEAIYYKKREKDKNATERLYALTVAFLIIKNVVCALPEFTTLQTNGSYEFVNIMRILAIIIVAPISVIWLVNILLYFKRIEKDTPFINALSEKYTQKAENTPDFFTCRSLSLVLYTILSAFILSFDLYVENVNLIPDFAFYGIALLLVVFLRKHVHARVRLAVISTLGALVSVAGWLLEKDFFSKYAIEAIIKDFDAYNSYNLLVCLYVVKGVLFAAITYLALREIYGIFKKYIGAKHDENDSYIAEHSKSIKTRALVCFVLGILSAISSIYRVVALPYYEISRIFYYSGIITGGIQIAFVVSVCALILYIVGEIKYNYKSFL